LHFSTGLDDSGRPIQSDWMLFEIDVAELSHDAPGHLKGRLKRYDHPRLL
jgi:hypothetical protein